MGGLNTKYSKQLFDTLNTFKITSDIGISYSRGNTLTRKKDNEIEFTPEHNKVISSIRNAKVKVKHFNSKRCLDEDEYVSKCLGWYMPENKTVYVYWPKRYKSGYDYIHVLLHEVGHYYSTTFLNDLGVEGIPPQYDEMFAELFALEAQKYYEVTGDYFDTLQYIYSSMPKRFTFKSFLLVHRFVLHLLDLHIFYSSRLKGRKH